MISINPSLTFEIWAIDFIGPFPIPSKRLGARYIIIAVEYVTKWAEAEPIDTCSSEVAANFIYENIITQFGCPLTLISDQGTHFINKTIKNLTDQFHIDHRWSTTYHPQSNGAIEAFNKTLTKGLTKICSTDKDDWDEKISVVLWAYRTAYKRSTDQTPFRLVYGQEAVVPLHFRQQTPIIAQLLHVNVEQARKDRLFQLSKLEEHRLMAIQHQEIHKQQ